MARASASARRGEAPFDEFPRAVVPRRRSGPIGVAPVAAPRTVRDAGTPRAPRPASPPVTAGRRTVTITGRGAERELADWQRSSRRRPAKRPHERAGSRPDRVAMWAVLMGVLLVLVAATSSHAVMLAAHGAHDVHHAFTALTAGHHIH